MARTNAPLTSKEVYQSLTDHLQSHFDFPDFCKKDGTIRLPVVTLFLVLYYAALHIRSLTGACRQCQIDPKVAAQALKEALPELDQLQIDVNNALAGRLPKSLRGRSHRLAIDVTLFPYYGQAGPDPLFFYRSQAKDGTCTFLACATVYLMTKGMRYTIAMTLVQNGDKMPAVLQKLLGQVAQTGIEPRLLLLDRGFYSVEVIRLLQSRKYPFIMPVICRGRKSGHPKGPSSTQVFAEMKKSGWYEYTMTDSKGNKVKFDVCVKCGNKGPKSKKGDKGRDALVYAYGEIDPGSFQWVKDTYRKRFGIETSYRQVKEARIPTTSASIERRYFYVAFALLLRNEWVWLHYERLATQRKGGRQFHPKAMTFFIMLSLLGYEARGHFDMLNSIEIPKPRKE